MSCVGRRRPSASRARRWRAAWLAVLFAAAPFAGPAAADADDRAAPVTIAAAAAAPLSLPRHAAAADRLHDVVIVEEPARLSGSKPGLLDAEPPVSGVDSYRLDLVLDAAPSAADGVPAGRPAPGLAVSHLSTGPPQRV